MKIIEMTEEEVLKLAETQLPNVEIYENEYIQIAVSKDLPFIVSDNCLPKERDFFVVTYRKITNHLNKTVWGLVSLDE